MDNEIWFVYNKWLKLFLLLEFVLRMFCVVILFFIFNKFCWFIGKGVINGVIIDIIVMINKKIIDNIVILLWINLENVILKGDFDLFCILIFFSYF